MLDRENTLLVVIDVQGKLATLMQDSSVYLGNLGTMIRGVRILDVPILWVEQLPEKLGATHPEIATLLANQEPIRKSSFSCLGSDEFDQMLTESKRSQILVTGIETHVCVYQTVCDLLDKGGEVHVVADAVASRRSTDKEIGLLKMRMAGAQLTSTETCLFELMKIAGTEEFRQVVKLIR